MSFISDAWKNITDAGKGLWDRVHGGGSQADPIQDPVNFDNAEESGSEIAEEGAPAPYVAPPKTIYPKHDPKRELVELMNLARLELGDGIVSRAKEQEYNVDVLNRKCTDLAKLQQYITKYTDKNGNFEAKDANTKQLLKRAKEHGLEIDETKTKYTKDERDELMGHIDRHARMLDKQVNDLQIKVRSLNDLFNNLYNTLTTALGKIRDTISKMCEGMRRN